MTYSSDDVEPVSNFSAFDRLRLYEKSLELQEEHGWGSRRIGDELGIKAGAVKNWIHNGSSPVTNMNKPDLSKEYDLSYIAGVVEGDGWTTNYMEKNGTERHTIGLEAISKKFVEEFQDRVKNLLGTVPKIHRRKNKEYRDTYVLTFDNILLYELFEENKEYVSNITQEICVPFYVVSLIVRVHLKFKLE